MFNLKINLDRHSLGPYPNIWLLPDLPIFLLPTTFKRNDHNVKQHDYNVKQHEYNVNQHDYNVTGHDYTKRVILRAFSNKKNCSLQRLAKTNCLTSAIELNKFSWHLTFPYCSRRYIFYGLPACRIWYIFRYKILYNFIGVPSVPITHNSVLQSLY